MTRTISAHFDGKVLIPDGACDLPAGQPLTLRVDYEPGPVDLTAVPRDRELTRGEVCLYGHEWYVSRIQPRLTPEDDGKLVAIDAVTGDYEIDAKDHLAISRMHARCAGHPVWLERAGEPEAYRFNGWRLGHGGTYDG